jgi:hypothetical protein
MSREVPFDEDAVCDHCGKRGAFDFMGDLICAECVGGILNENEPEEEPDNGNTSRMG